MNQEFKMTIFETLFLNFDIETSHLNALKDQSKAPFIIFLDENFQTFRLFYIIMTALKMI